MEESLGKRIAANRKSLGLTQDALAERLGVTAQAVSKWENDQSCPDINTLPKLAVIFNCSVDALLGVSKPEAKHPAALDSDSGKPEKDHLLEINWDWGKKGSIASALWILLLGIYLTLGAYFHWQLYFWTAAIHCGLTAFGLMGFFSGLSVFRIGCLAAGLYWMAEGTGFAAAYFSESRRYVFPIILMLLGIHLLITGINKKQKPYFSMLYNGKPVGTMSNRCTYEKDAFYCSTSFGENHHLIDLPEVRSGEASVSFGELEVDLRGCKEIADGCHLSLESYFGELTLIVPKHCRVTKDISTAFADVSLRGNPSEDADTMICVSGKASFGDIEIEYR